MADEPPVLVEITDVLDLTTSHFSDKDLQNVPMPATLTKVDLTENRLKGIDERIQTLPDLRSLSLRHNLLQSAQTLSKLESASVLETLILQDNQLKELPPLDGFSALQQLEISYNEIRSIQGLRDLPTDSLQQLFAASNKIKAIEGLQRLRSLKILELGSNRITTIIGLEGLECLEELWLGSNRISSMQGLGRLPQLKKLSVQSNRLERVEGLEECTGLQELYLSHNGICSLQVLMALPSEVMEPDETEYGMKGCASSFSQHVRQAEGTGHLRRLETLDVSNNAVTALDDVCALPRLKDLWLNDNHIGDLESTMSALKGLQETLTCIYLANNPATSGADQAAVKQRILSVLPRLEQLDSESLQLKC